MTNEELDQARAEHAWSEHYKNDPASPTVIAARLAREGWTPPVPVDPDLAEVEKLYRNWEHSPDPSPERLFLEAIKRGRALAAAEAKPGMVWVKYDGSGECPTYLGAYVCIRQKHSGVLVVAQAKNVPWRDITHYCKITLPENVA